MFQSDNKEKSLFDQKIVLFIFLLSWQQRAQLRVTPPHLWITKMTLGTSIAP